MIKFTFNLNQVFEKFNKNFMESSQHICMIDYDRLITQKDIYESLPKETKYQNVKGYCVLASIYNSFCNIFETMNDFIDFVKKQVDTNKKYYSLETMTKEINIFKKDTYLYSKHNSKESYEIFVNSILENKPVVISYQLQNNVFINGFVAHAISLFGYDDNLIYYKENSEDNYLFKSLAYYIKQYYNIFELKETNPEYYRLKDYLACNDENQLWEKAKNILGYNLGNNGISCIRKCFLTNDIYFYDTNGIITSNKKIDNYSYFGDTNCCKFNLSDLTNRLMIIHK